MKTRYKPSQLAQLTLTQEGSVKSFDGTQLWYRVSGNGYPILFCNGLGCSTFYFKYLEPFFRQHFKVITWDYRGHGRSEAPKVKKNHTLTSLVSDLKAVLDHLKIEKAIFLGHSMGSQVVFEFVTLYPQRVKAIISCFGTFGNPLDAFYNTSLSKYVFEGLYIFNHLFPRLAKQLSKILFKNPLWFQFGSLLKMMQPYLVDKEVMKLYIDHITNVDPIFFSSLLKSMENHTNDEDYKKIRTPTLIIGGEDDTFTPLWVARKMHHLLANSEFFIVKKGSHIALVEQPELINLRVEKFLNEAVFKSKKNKNVKPLKNVRRLKPSRKTA